MKSPIWYFVLIVFQASTIRSMDTVCVWLSVISYFHSLPVRFHMGRFTEWKIYKKWSAMGFTVYRNLNSFKGKSITNFSISISLFSQVGFYSADRLICRCYIYFLFYTICLFLYMIFLLAWIKRRKCSLFIA